MHDVSRISGMPIYDHCDAGWVRLERDHHLKTMLTSLELK